MLLCLACAVLERSEAQITLRSLGDELMHLAAEPELEATGFRFIAPVMGHNDSRMVERVYGRLPIDDLAKRITHELREDSEFCLDGGEVEPGTCVGSTELMGECCDCAPATDTTAMMAAQ